MREDVIIKEDRKGKYKIDTPCYSRIVLGDGHLQNTISIDIKEKPQ